MSKPDILQKILHHKAQEIRAARKHRPEAELRKDLAAATAPRSFYNALAGEPLAIIAEIKRSSPSEGLIRADFDPRKIAQSYAEHGAAALSVLTDEHFFGGRLDYLAQLRPLTGLPLLRKDFILDVYQVLQTRVYGADALLLIAAVLTPGRLQDLLRETHHLGMDALVEVHNPAELDIALQAGARIIGVNNRNLATFETDLATTEKLAARVPADRLLVAESGICSAQDVRRMRDAGAAAILVGSHFMRQADPGKALQQFREACYED